MLANVITPLVDTQIRNVIADLVPKYDRNGNKKLNLQELIGFLNEAMDLFGWEIKVTREDTQQTLTSFDKNWDGELSYEEIYTTLRHIISKQLTGQQYFKPQPIPAQLRTANQPGIAKPTNTNHSGEKEAAGGNPWASTDHKNSQQKDEIEIPEPTILDDEPTSNSKNSAVPSILKVSQPKLQVTHSPSVSKQQAGIRLTQSKYVWNANDEEPTSNDPRNSTQLTGSQATLTFTQSPSTQHRITNSTLIESVIPGPNQDVDILSSHFQAIQLNPQPIKHPEPAHTTHLEPPKEKLQVTSPWVRTVETNGWQGVQINTVQDLKLKRLVDDLYNRYDKDLSGTLDIDELVPAFLSIGQEMQLRGASSNQTQAVRLLKLFDRSGDGRFQRHEMYNCLRSLLQH